MFNLTLSGSISSPFDDGEMSVSPFWGSENNDFDMVLESPDKVTFSRGASSAYQTGVSSYSGLSLALCPTDYQSFVVVGLSLLTGGVTASSVTFGGTAMSLIRRRTGSSGVVPAQQSVELWGLVAPTADGTAQTIAVTLSGASDLVVFATGLCGVQQVTPYEAANDTLTQQGLGVTAASLTIACRSPDTRIVDNIACSDNAITASTNNRLVGIVAGASASGAQGLSDQIDPAASTTVTWENVDNPATYTIVGVAIRPAADSPTTVTTTDSLTYSDSASRSAPVSKTATDSLTFAESISRNFSPGARGPTDSLTTAESMARTFVGFRTTSDAPHTAESMSRVAVLFRTAAETLSTSESIADTKVAVRTATDNPTFAESVSRLFVGARTTTDAPHTAESMSRVAALGRAITDALTTSEVVARILANKRNVTDAPSYSESVNAGHGATSVTATDSLTAAQIVASSSSHPRSTSDAPAFAESVSRAGLLPRAGTDAPAYAESAVRTRVEPRTAVDQLTVAESVVRSQNSPRGVADSLSAACASSRSCTLSRGIADALILADYSRNQPKGRLRTKGIAGRKPYITAVGRSGRA